MKSRNTFIGNKTEKASGDGAHESMTILARKQQGMEGTPVVLNAVKPPCSLYFFFDFRFSFIVPLLRSSSFFKLPNCLETLEWQNDLFGPIEYKPGPVAFLLSPFAPPAWSIQAPCLPSRYLPR